MVRALNIFSLVVLILCAPLLLDLIFMHFRGWSLLHSIICFFKGHKLTRGYFPKFCGRCLKWLP